MAKIKNKPFLFSIPQIYLMTKYFYHLGWLWAGYVEENILLVCKNKPLCLFQSGFCILSHENIDNVFNDSLKRTWQPIKSKNELQIKNTKVFNDFIIMKIYLTICKIYTNFSLSTINMKF